MNNPKRHHYIPRLLIKNFTDSFGYVYAFDKRHPDQGIYRAKPENVFVEKHLYSTIDEEGSRDPSFEIEMGILETQADQIIQKLIISARKGIGPTLKQSEKETWINFFILQWSRTPETASQIPRAITFDLILPKLISEFEDKHRPLSPAERENLRRPETLNRIRKNAEVNSLRYPNREPHDILRNKRFGIVKIDVPNTGFVLGSRPILKCTLPGRSHLADPTVEAWLPLSSDLIISPMPLDPRFKNLVSISDTEEIQKINEGIYKQSSVIVGESVELIRSLAAEDLR